MPCIFVDILERCRERIQIILAIIISRENFETDQSKYLFIYF